MERRVSGCLKWTAFLAVVGAALGCDGSGGRIQVEDAWVRAVEVAPGHSSNTAAYMRIESHAASTDRLLEVRTEFASAELHRTTIDAPGLATMAPAGSITVEPGESVRLEPGGLHVMLMELKRSLRGGDAVDIILVFETAGEVTARAEVRKF